MSRWNLLRHLLQSFWKHWSKHYLHTIIQCNKWHKSTTPIEVNQLFILYGVNTSPADWPLARVTATHPSPDGIVRVFTIQTADGTYTRPFNRIIPVPSGIENL